MGLYQALLQDKTISDSEKTKCEEAVGKHIRSEGKLDPSRARELEELVGYCQVKRYSKTAYINILLRDTQAGDIFFPILKQALDKAGRRDWTGGIPTGCHKELKGGLELAQKARRGNGSRT